MATSPEEWKARRARREEMRAKQKAKQRKLLILLLGAVAVLLVVGGLIVTLVSRAEKTPQAEDPAQVQEQSEDTAPADEAKETTKTIRIAAAGDLNVTDKVVASGGMNYDYTATFMDVRTFWRMRTSQL